VKAALLSACGMDSIPVHFCGTYMFRYMEFAYQAGNIFTLQVFISQAFDMRRSVLLPKLVITC
jgi:hypothetical protein